MDQQETADLKTTVINEIMRYIRAMDLDKDRKLPREEAFCKLLGISRVTLRTALDTLEASGIIFRRHGKGTFVNVHSMDIRVSFNPVMDIYDMILFSGYEPGVKLVATERIAAPDWLRASMELTEGEVHYTRKIFYADKKFCAYTEDFLNLTYLDNPQRLNDVSFSLPVFPMLDREFGIRVEWDKVELDVADGKLLPELAALPDVPAYPLLLLKGMNYDVADRPVLYTKEYIDTSLIRFSQIRKRNAALPLRSPGFCCR